LHFKAHGYTIYIWKNKEKEIDFVVEKNWIIIYIQVAYLITSAETKAREFDNLLQIQDNYEKIVLSMDDFVDGDYKWGKHYNLVEYLLWFPKS
jgi:predicted AAA+ superfamily ATPase